MATGSFSFTLTDLPGQAIHGDARIDLDPAPGQNGVGGVSTRVKVGEGQRTVTIAGIPCRPSLGTSYRVGVWTNTYKHYAFFQHIVDGDNMASEGRVRLVANPKKVVEISAPGLSKVPAAFARAIQSAGMWRLRAEDADLVGFTNTALYSAMGPLRKACLLNIARKASHSSSARIGRFVEALHVIRQDRCFVTVHPDIHDAMRASDLFKSADGSLHAPPPHYQFFESFKTRDAHANLQVTLFRHTTTAAMVADIDIDEASGIKHGHEVIRNKVGNSRTNPYLGRELMLLSDAGGELDPDYRFVFA
jgi:hypothetical protein